MAPKLFDRPVYLKETKDLVREITSIEDAIDYLEEWPERKRDLVHDVVLKTCYVAYDGLEPIRSARDAVRAFGKKKGILVKQPAVQPWMVKTPAGGGRVTF